MSRSGLAEKRLKNEKVEEPTELRVSRRKKTRIFSTSPTKSTSPKLKNPISNPTNKQSDNQ
ncbi:hypothetical protein, partial [Leptospira levettii]|uniref:hypothetical protein n=1 Tax=Leptospira levettii TaxID=2023178 RepID=UPI001A9CB26C